MGIPNEKINWIQNILLFAMLLKIKIDLYNQPCCVDIYNPYKKFFPRVSSPDLINFISFKYLTKRYISFKVKLNV